MTTVKDIVDYMGERCGTAAEIHQHSAAGRWKRLQRGKCVCHVQLLLDADDETDSMKGFMVWDIRFI